MNAAEASEVKAPGGELRFLLDGEVVRIRDVSPQTTLLEFLRERLGRTGTKEGCAEGDCGACTVVLGEPACDGGLAWRPINACIRLLPTIDGKALFTVESDFTLALPAPQDKRRAECEQHRHRIADW